MADYSRQSDDLPASQLPPPAPSARERSVSMSQANLTSPGAEDGGASQAVNGGGGAGTDDAGAGAVAGTAVTDMSAKVQEVLASDVCLADQPYRE